MFDEIKRYGDNAVGAFVNALYVEALLDKKKTGWRQENESYSGLISGGEISREVEKLHGHPILLPNMSSLNVEARSQVEAFAKLFLTELVAEIKDVGPLSRALEVKGINLDSIQVDRVAKMLTEKSPAIDNR